MYNSVYFLQYTSGSVSYNSVYSSKLRLKSCITLYSFFSILVGQLVTGLWIRFSLHLMKCILKIWNRQHVSNEWINGQYEWISWGYEWINKQFYGQIDYMIILNSTDDSFFEEDLYRTYETRQTSLFNRTFKQNEYFYCKNCKQYTFVNKNGACLHNNSYCSYLTLEKSIFYLGDFDKDYPKSKYL